MKRVLPPALLPDSAQKSAKVARSDLHDIPVAALPKQGDHVKIGLLEHLCTKLSLPKLRNSDEAQGLQFGLVVDRKTQLPALSAASRERPNLFSLLLAVARDKIPGFQFTSIQLSRNSKGLGLHTDSRDISDNAIITFGSYDGGELFHSTAGVLNPFHSVKKFDTSLPHVVLPFTGVRWSLVFNSLRCYPKTSLEVYWACNDKGMPFP